MSNFSIITLGGGRHIWVDFLLATFAPSSGQTFWCELSCVHSLFRKPWLESLVIIWICLGCWGLCLSCWRSYYTEWCTAGNVCHTSRTVCSWRARSPEAGCNGGASGLGLHISQNHCGHTESPNCPRGGAE